MREVLSKRANVSLPTARTHSSQASSQKLRGRDYSILSFWNKGVLDFIGEAAAVVIFRSRAGPRFNAQDTKM